MSSNRGGSLRFPPLPGPLPTLAGLLHLHRTRAQDHHLSPVRRSPSAGCRVACDIYVFLLVISSVLWGYGFDVIMYDVLKNGDPWGLVLDDAVLQVQKVCFFFYRACELCGKSRLCRSRVKLKIANSELNCSVI